MKILEFRTEREIFTPGNRSNLRIHNKGKNIKFSHHIVLIGVLLLTSAQMHAQPKVRLVRTNKATAPLKFQIYGGYNGMSTPDDRLQDRFENTNETNWGGFMMGIKALIAIDTIGIPFWMGVNGYTHRTMKRSLYDAPTVHYPDSQNPVQAIETVFSYGIEGIIAFGPFARTMIEIGGGAQRTRSSVDHPSVIIGLFQDVWLPTVMTAVNFELLKYEHGSIDANIRFLKTFGDYQNFQLESLFCFTFNL